MKKIRSFFPQRAFRLLLFMAGLLLFNESFATHLMGGELEYTCIGPRKWAITLIVYRTCDNGSVPLCSSFNCQQSITATPSPSISAGGINPDGCTSNPASITVALQLLSVEDVGKMNTARCGPSAKNGCDNLGQVVPGNYNPSIEKYVFSGTLDMSLPSLNAACPYWDLGWSYCCRNSSVNIQGQPNFYIQATLDIFAGTGAAGSCKNSSPQFRNEPLSVHCAGKLININPGAVDPDGDELSFKLVKAFQAVNTPVNYNTPYSEKWPFPLVSTSPPHSSYPGQPFLVLDSVTGDIAFNPNNPTSQLISGTVNIEVSQWGYKENPAVPGTKVRYLKGITYRDIMLMSGPCAGNNIPYIKTMPEAQAGKPKTNWTVCAGEKICFTVTAKDSDLQPGSDTTYLRLSSSTVIPGNAVSFLPAYDINVARPREDAYEFCWQTGENDGRSFPYIFTIAGADNRCPEPGKVVQSFAITVLPKDSAIQIISQPQAPLMPQVAYDYAVKQLEDVIYEWSISNGTFVGGNTSANVTVKWNIGQGVLKLKQSLGSCIDSVSFTADVESVGLKDQTALNNLVIKPNPNKGLFSIAGDDLVDTRISVINMLGQTIIDARKIPSNGIIDMRDLAEGVYYLNVMKKERNVVLKLVIR